MSIIVAGKEIEDGKPVFIVAEMAWAHDGSMDYAKSIVRAAADGGADCINFHITDVDAYITRDYGALPGQKGGGYSYLKDREFSADDWFELASYAREYGLSVSAMCNDFPSISVAAEKVGADLMMIHPSCITETEFVAEVARAGLPTVLYLGALRLEEVDRAIQVFQGAGNENVILQHGFQAYPTPIENNNLKFIATLKDLYGFPVAFGDHTDGGDGLALTLPILSIAYGANIIEKHLTWDRSAKGTDFQSSLDPESFKEFVRQLRLAEKATGSAMYPTLGELEMKYRQTVRKRAVAATDVAEGTLLKREHVAFKRANDGVYPEELDLLLGREMTAGVRKDQPLTLADVK